MGRGPVLADNLCASPRIKLSFPCHVPYLTPWSSLGNGPAIAASVKAKQIDLKVVSNFIPKMARKWYMIGIQLHQDELVQGLQQPNLDPQSNLTQILQAAKQSEENSLTYGTLLAALRSEAVNLPKVATKLLRDAIDCERQRELVQQATNGDQPPSRHSQLAPLFAPALLLVPTVFPPGGLLCP